MRTELLEYDKGFVLLKRYKIRAAHPELAKSEDDLIKKSNKLGYPVVVKINSKKIIHKSDIGGVIANISDDDSAVKGFKALKMLASKQKTKFLGAYVQEFISGNLVYIGAKRDSQFGPVITFGLGGIYVEVFKDIAYRIAPLDMDKAEAMIKETKAYQMLTSRGNTINIKAIVDILLGVSKLMLANEDVVELDLNPVIVSKKDAIVADVRILRGK